jgi:UTP--glucose-1-phosphate uridylyltransferase
MMGRPVRRGAPSALPIRGVLTLAGEGTRMLPWSRGLRKEFLPLFDGGDGGGPVLKPIAHLVLESMLGAGVQDATLVVRPRDLATVRNYFTVDPSFLRGHRVHPERFAETRRWYERLGGLRLHFATQARPSGFGDAVLRAETSVGDSAFLLHACDAVLLEPERGRLLRTMAELLAERDLDAVLLVRRVVDPRRYGVVEGALGAPFRGRPTLVVHRMVEKPLRPRSRWAATAAYAFRPRLFRAIRAARAEHPRGAEVEVTWGIQRLIDDGGSVAALTLQPPEGWSSVGTPEGYLRALRASRLRVHART